MISAFDDPLIIAGQGTLGREWVKQRPETSAFVIPISGGGLISGCAIAMCASATPPLVFGVGLAVGGWLAVVGGEGR